MKTRIISGLAVLSCFFAVLSAFAYEDEDVQLWNTESIEARLNDHWKVIAEQEFRIGDNISDLYYIHTQGGLDYKVTDGLHLGIDYRQVWEKEKDNKWTRENRPQFNGTVKWNWYGFDFSDRSRLEFRILENKDDRWRYRNKLTASLPWKWTGFDIRPYVADEIFVDFYGERINRNRLYAGITFKLVKNFNADLFYLRQSSKKNNKWTNINAIGVKLKAAF
jgi:hypothetical protein